MTAAKTLPIKFVTAKECFCKQSSKTEAGRVGTDVLLHFERKHSKICDFRNILKRTKRVRNVAECCVFIYFVL